LIEARYTCEGYVQAGSLYLPAQGNGPFAAVVWVHGGGQDTRIVYNFPVFRDLVRDGVAVFSFDKRGVGKSQGKCCPGDHGHFNLLTADVEGAITALRSRADIDPNRIGLLGASQAGWIAPRAAADSHAAFLALASAGILPYEQVKAYAKLTGGDGSDKPFPSKQRIANTMKSASRGGYDPGPDLQRLAAPALWMFGTADREVPVDASTAFLARLKASGKPYTITTFPGAGHGLLNTPPTASGSFTTVVDWIEEQTGTRSKS